MKSLRNLAICSGPPKTQEGRRSISEFSAETPGAGGCCLRLSVGPVSKDGSVSPSEKEGGFTSGSREMVVHGKRKQLEVRERRT